MTFIKLCKSILLFLHNNSKEFKFTNNYIDVSFNNFFKCFQKLIKSCPFIKNSILLSSSLKDNTVFSNFDMSNHNCHLCNMITDCDNIKDLYNLILRYSLEDKNLKDHFETKKSKNCETKKISCNKHEKYDNLINEINFSLDLISFFNNIFKDDETLEFYKMFFNNELQSTDNVGKLFLDYLLKCKKICKIKSLVTKDLVIPDTKYIYEEIFSINNCNCKVCNYLDRLSIDNFIKLVSIFDDNFNFNKFQYYLNNKELIKRKFTIFRKNNYNNNECQWYKLFENKETFIRLKRDGFFIKLIGIVRYFMLPLVHYKNNPHDYSIKHYDKYCSLTVKEWNKYAKKHVDKFYIPNTVIKKCIDISYHHDFYLEQIKSFQDEIIKHDVKEKYQYIFNIDETNVYECFCASYNKIMDECKYILNILNTINNFSNYNKLKKFIDKNKIYKLNSILGNIIREWISIYNKRDIYFERLNSKYKFENIEYNLDILLDIDNITNFIIDEELLINDDEYIEEDIEEYSPETVQRMINEFKA